MKAGKLALKDIAISAIALGAISTLADWIWEHYLEDGALLPAIVHGVAIFIVLALVLGRSARTRNATTKLLASLPLVGLLLAAAFYPLAAITGYLTALILSWLAMWLALAILQSWASGRMETPSVICLRAAIAAVGSGLAFWTISGIWTDPPADPDYALRLLAWIWAFLPGFVGLLAPLGRVGDKR